MRKSDVRSTPAAFDLNLLRFFQALIETASITRAGEASGMSQPAASRATARLRQHFSDPLLVRTQTGYVLTPVAEALAPSIRRALTAADQVLDTVSFDPTSSARRFRLASTDYGTTAVVLQSLPLLRREAPHTRLQIDPWTEETLLGLQRGLLDCALYADEPIPPDFHSRRLFSDGYALVYRTGHPLQKTKQATARGMLTAASEFPQFAPRYAFGRTHITDDVYSRMGMPIPRLALEAPHFSVGALAVLTGEVVAVLPERAARLWAQGAKFAVVPLKEARLRFEYRVIWHERAHRDPGIKWLRECFVKGCAAG